MADRPQLRNPLLRVVMDDGAVHEVQALNPDLVAWDKTRARHHWPKTEDAPMLWLTFVAFCALRREELIPQMSYDDFERRAWEVGTVDGDGGAATVDPTNPGREAG